MTADESAGVEERPTIHTVRPAADPVVVALTSDDSRAAFRELMRDRLVPEEWEYPIVNGFAWIPFRLKHSIGAGFLQ